MAGAARLLAELALADTDQALLVDRIKTWAPLFDSGDDFVWIGGRLAIERLDPRGPSSVAEQTLEPFFQEAFLPAPNANLGLAGSSHDLVRAGPIGREENNLGSPHVLLRDIAIVDAIFKPTPIGQDETVMDFPARIAQTCTCRKSGNSQ